MKLCTSPRLREVSGWVWQPLATQPAMRTPSCCPALGSSSTSPSRNQVRTQWEFAGKRLSSWSPRNPQSRVSRRMKARMKGDASTWAW
jgi:hypothetical protein